MLTLGIDTTFAVTSASVVRDGRIVLSNELRKYEGGFSGELYRLPFFHLKHTGAAIKAALAAAGVKPEDLSLVAAGNSGSLGSALAVGVAAAEALSAALDIPLIGVEHQEAHFFSTWLERDPAEIRYPVISLSASGATSSIALIRGHFDLKELAGVEVGGSGKAGSPVFLGVGTAYTFLAQRLGLGSGESIGHLVSKFAGCGSPDRFVFGAPPKRRPGDLDLSWLKAEIDRLIEAERRRSPGKNRLSPKFAADMCAGFESAVSGLLVGDLLKFAVRHGAREIHLAGGISANTALRAALERAAAERGLAARVPAKTAYSTDNAAMIAGRGYYLYGSNPRKYRSARSAGVVSDLKLDRIAASQFLSDGNNQD